ncbi:MAG: penicillin-binding transpeptidase domain-containing protein [Acetobacter sp.]|nr:penicillin-binding transpeptidase domain-containing protein [Bacteroides sp.]MCM1340512.1 penicillin-binding transpeptidase domain-containing protein [Acetobacter sp.]MCM1433252.1 penicillin-binding transpeptidase domain-containing protein [Clostridiales bacterium]
MLKRCQSLIIVFVLMFTSIAGRCGYIAMSNYYTVSESYNSYTIDVGELYTNIFDRYGRLLNNYKSEKIAVISTNEKALSELDKLFYSSEVTEIREELSKGYPVKRKVSKNSSSKYISQFDRIIQNPDDMPARNLLDKTYGGLENYVDKKIGELSVNFAVDARGRLLNGDSVTVNDDNYDSREGVIITLDSKLQKIAEDASKYIQKGAVIILDTSTSQILASVSRGNDYVNRAVSSYSVGSVFKLVVCACALENNVNIKYDCKSSITVGDTTFNCQKKHSHGYQNMEEALANSCNCYFVNLALHLGADKICDTAKNLGFGDSYTIYNNWNINAGAFPENDVLANSKGQLALIGFGQGMLTDSPMHFASVISCIANGGKYNSPTLDFNESTSKNTLSARTCRILRKYMHNVVVNGTGYFADYKNSTAGKTATAQSGVFVDGKEILNTWFAGFYPYNNPKYAIVVMQEDGTTGSENCCPVFRTIVEKIDEL